MSKAKRMTIEHYRKFLYLKRAYQTTIQEFCRDKGFNRSSFSARFPEWKKELAEQGGQ